MIPHHQAKITSITSIILCTIIRNFVIYNTTTTVLWSFVWDYTGELVPEETFTHSHVSRSSIILYQLPTSTTIHSILPVQFTCLTVFLHNLCPSPVVYLLVRNPTLHIPYMSSPNHGLFCNTCPYCRNMFCCSSEIKSSIPGLSQLCLELFLLPWHHNILLYMKPTSVFTLCSGNLVNWC